MTDESNDLAIENGSFKLGSSENQDADRIIQAHPGEFKQSPLVGVGISRYLNASARPVDVEKEVKKGLELDGLIIDELRISDDFKALTIKVTR